MKTRRIIYLLLAIMLLLSACDTGDASSATDSFDPPDGLPEEANAFLLQFVGARPENIVYVSGLAGNYDYQGGFSALSDRVYTFPLCGNEDAFAAYLWEPDLAGATSRTQFYGINSFVSFYRHCIEKELFEPVACNFDFNEAGEITELYECADLSYSIPEPEEPEAPEVPLQIDLRTPPEDPTFALLAEEAILDSAPDIVLEPDAPPYNLGGWKYNNAAAWAFDIVEEGNYIIGVLYSRPSAWAEWGTLKLFHSGSADDETEIRISFQVDATGEDWSVYSYTDIIGVYLEPGSYWLEIFPGSDRGSEFSSDYFINLQSVLFYHDAQRESQSKVYPVGELTSEVALDLLYITIGDKLWSNVFACTETEIDGKHCWGVAFGDVVPEDDYAVADDGTVYVLDKDNNAYVPYAAE